MEETETEVTVEAVTGTGTEMAAVALAAAVEEDQGLETVAVAAGSVEVVGTEEAAMEEVVAASRESNRAVV